MTNDPSGPLASASPPGAALTSLDAGYDYDAPLRWEHEDGRRGTEVAHIPAHGRVFFFDEKGPVLRLDNVREARWLVKQIHFRRLNQILPVRITRLVGTSAAPQGEAGASGSGDGYFYILPNPGQPIVIHCTRDRGHDGCRENCLLLEDAVKKWIEAPIVAAAKAAG